MKITKKVLVLLLIALIALQFYRPEKNDAEVRDVTSFEKETKPAPLVAGVLQTKCYDCHSNKTEYPWYSEVAPVSLWLSGHVEEGTEHFNASAWDSYKDKKKDHKLEELIEEVEEGEMPLNEYTWLHGGSLSQAEKDAVIAWAKEARKKYKSAVADGQ